MTLLPTILSERPKVHNSFLLLQSSTSQSALPILRRVVAEQANHGIVVLLCTLYSPSDLSGSVDVGVNVRVINWTSYVPGYQEYEVHWNNKIPEIQERIQDSTSGPLTFVVDSIDTLDEDLESSTKTYKLLSQILSLLQARSDNSRLVCHLTVHSALLPLLKQPAFSTSLVHITTHPPALLTHIASAYLTVPPLMSSEALSSDALKFWRIFVPLAERPHDVDALVFGPEGDGSAGGGPSDELVVEIIVRGRMGEGPLSLNSNAGMTSGRRKGVERVLEGWCPLRGGPIKLEEMDSLKTVWRRKTIIEQSAPDPTKDLSFNLSLTESQQASRSQVPLPYEHDGRISETPLIRATQIFYDPDSADDFDDEDPDEDLDI